LTTPRSIPIPDSVLGDLLAHAAAAAHNVGHLDDSPATDLLADDLDAIVHKLSELLGTHLIAIPAPSALLSIAPDINAPEHVVPEVSRVSCLPPAVLDPAPGALPADDELTQPRVRQLRPPGCPCQRTARQLRPAHRRQHHRGDNMRMASGHPTGAHSEPRWVRSAIVTALVALLAVLAFLLLGACHDDAGSASTRDARTGLVTSARTGCASSSPISKTAAEVR